MKIFKFLSISFLFLFSIFIIKNIDIYAVSYNDVELVSHDVISNDFNNFDSSKSFSKIFIPVSLFTEYQAQENFTSKSLKLFNEYSTRFDINLTSDKILESYIYQENIGSYPIMDFSVSPFLFYNESLPIVSLSIENINQDYYLFDFYDSYYIDSPSLDSSTIYGLLNYIYFSPFNVIVPDVPQDISLISEIGSIISQFITIFSGWLLSIFNIGVLVFYSFDSGLTSIGVLSLIGLGISLVMFGLKYVFQLFKR